MTQRTTQERIAEFQAKIVALEERDKRKAARASPEVKHLSASLKSLDKALNASDDQPLRKTLDEARTIVVSGLDLLGAPPKPAKERGAKKRAKAKLETELNAAEVLTYVKNNPGEKGEAIAAAFDTDTATLRPLLQELAKAGKLKSQGKGRGTTYHAAGNLVATAS